MIHWKTIKGYDAKTQCTWEPAEAINAMELEQLLMINKDRDEPGRGQPSNHVKIRLSKHLKERLVNMRVVQVYTRDDGAVSLILEMLNVPISRSGKKETAAINLTTMNTERLDGKLTEIAFVGYDVPFSPNASPGHRNPRRRHSNQRRRVVCNRQRRRMVSNRVDVVLPPKYTSELVHALHNEREMARTEFLKTKVLRCQCADYYAQAEAAEREAKADAKYSKYVNEMAVQIGLRMSMEGNTA